MHQDEEEYYEDDEFDRAVLALRFIQTCNENMGFRAWPEYDGTKVENLDLHPAQEGAFRMACKCLGRFFSDGKTEVSPANFQGSNGKGGET